MNFLPRHGVLISFKNLGIFLVGESGTGKTETSLQLIQQGAILVCDDAPQFMLNKNNNEVYGVCPDGFDGLMHLRDIGVINVIELLGKKYFKKQQRIDYIVELVHDNNQKKAAVNLKANNTLWHFQQKQSLIEIPGIIIHTSANRNIPLLIQMAITQSTLSRAQKQENTN